MKMHRKHRTVLDNVSSSTTTTAGKAVRCRRCGAVLVYLGHGNIGNTVIECNECKARRRWVVGIQKIDVIA